MRVKFKLFATLADYLPQPAKSNEVELEVPPGTTVDSLIARYNLPRNLVHLVLVNGLYVDPAARSTSALKDGDVLAIWPPIAGG
jgi:molybdopterin converting factor small subunit